MITDFHHQVTQPPSVTQATAGGRTAEAVQHSEFVIGKLTDAATPKLLEAACKGTHIPEVTIECWRAGGDPVKYYEVKLKEVLISGVTHTGNPAGTHGFPTETVSMTYGSIAWTYTKQKPDGTGGGNVAAKWSLAQGTTA
jgi:type VI secretion system secreted protein Hcp